MAQFSLQYPSSATVDEPHVQFSNCGFYRHNNKLLSILKVAKKLHA